MRGGAIRPSRGAVLVGRSIRVTLSHAQELPSSQGSFAAPWSPAGARCPRDVPYIVTTRADETQREIVLRMTGSERVRLASEMSEMALALAIAGLRHRHPEWTETEARKAYARGVIAAGARRTAG